MVKPSGKVRSLSDGLFFCPVCKKNTFHKDTTDWKMTCQDCLTWNVKELPYRSISMSQPPNHQG